MKNKNLTLIKKQRLDEIKERFSQEWTGRRQVLICSNTGCQLGEGTDKLIAEFKAQIEKRKLSNIEVEKTGCFGLCAWGPVLAVYPDEIVYFKVKLADVSEIVENHLKNNQPVKRLLYTLNEKQYEKLRDIPFYQNQKLIATNYLGKLNPERIEDYIAVNGYFALEKALNKMTPEEVIAEMKKSGLRGRGGAGFPTGTKWEFARANKSEQKYIICNGDEGDPGAFMDRSVAEYSPHAILEAMAIAGYAIGANQGIVYIRTEYPLAASRLQNAIEKAREYGFLGEQIFGSDFKFDIEIKLGAGAFVCGEETALIHSCEGMRGEPSTKPPFPAQSGYLKQPTIINNVETLANIPQIILNGGEWYASMGTENSKGTKVFALSGKVNNTGIVEMPMGTTIEELIFGVGGGIPKGKEFKAVQMGGPSGGCIPAKFKQTKIDYDSLKALGAIMGSGGVIVMDEDTCMVDIAKFFIEFCVDESCGKCTPCRIGNKRLLEILTKITNGKGEMSDLDELENLGNYIKNNSLCGLGQTSPNPVLSTLRYYKDEYIEHIKNKRCPAHVCKALMKYEIKKDKCVGCSLCSRICPVNAISGEVGKTYVIDQNICIKCGKCFESCRFNAIERR